MVMLPQESATGDLAHLGIILVQLTYTQPTVTQDQPVMIRIKGFMNFYSNTNYTDVRPLAQNEGGFVSNKADVSPLMVNAMYHQFFPY